MKVVTIIFTIAITMAVSITLTMKTTGLDKEDNPHFKSAIDTADTFSSKWLALHGKKLMPSNELSRFLAEDQTKSPRGSCRKDHETCYLDDEGYNATCCNKKCTGLAADHENCGKCKKKCEFTEHCCSGKCVELSSHKGHCGRCGKQCAADLVCNYGMCDYP